MFEQRRTEKFETKITLLWSKSFFCFLFSTLCYLKGESLLLNITQIRSKKDISEFVIGIYSKIILFRCSTFTYRYRESQTKKQKQNLRRSKTKTKTKNKKRKRNCLVVSRLLLLLFLLLFAFEFFNNFTKQTRNLFFFLKRCHLRPSTIETRMAGQNFIALLKVENWSRSNDGWQPVPMWIVARLQAKHHFTLPLEMYYLDVVRLLLDSGADIDAQDTTDGSGCVI